jgi:mannose-6-phosphate isomerase-like protein (cupin superfamily)
MIAEKHFLPVLLILTLLLGGNIALAQDNFPFQPDSEYKERGKTTAYERFLEAENIPVYTGWAKQMYTAPVKPWKRHGTGVSGAYANLEGTGGSVDNWVMELAPGATSKPVRHMYDENLLILSGEGETHIWREAAPEKKAVIRWRKGTLFVPPLNTWHQHFNKGSEPARIVAETSLPLIMDIYRSNDFVFNNPFDFPERYNSEPDYFDPENSVNYGPTTEHHSLSVVNLVRNVWTARLFNAGQGYKDIDRHFNMSESSIGSHVEQFPVGTYERAHYHNAGATIVLLTGTGYSLLWPSSVSDTPWKDGKGDQVHRTNWESGVLFVPPTNWYHQHFNNGTEPARFIRLGSPPGTETHPIGAEGLKSGNTQLSFKEEDPYVRDLLEQEMIARGGEIAMPPREELIRLEEEAGGKFIVLSAEELK